MCQYTCSTHALLIGKNHTLWLQTIVELFRCLSWKYHNKHSVDFNKCTLARLQSNVYSTYSTEDKLKILAAEVLGHLLDTVIWSEMKNSPSSLAISNLDSFLSMNLSISASQSSQLVNEPAVMLSRSVCDCQSILLISLSVKQPISNNQWASQLNSMLVSKSVS